MKLASSDPVGSILIANRRFGEIDLHRVRPGLKATSYLDDVLGDQVFDELLSRIVGDSFSGYIRLKADGEITACFTGTVA